MRRLTAETLQLYSDEPTAEVAAREISAAVLQARNAIRSAIRVGRVRQPGYGGVGEGARIVGRVYREVVYPVLSKHDDAGACDTEPRGVVAQKLVDAAKDALGIDHYCPELGDAI